MRTIRAALRPSALLAVAAAVLHPLAGQAGSPVVEGVKVTPGAAGFTFRVTVRHDDAGWNHYADAFVVLAPDGAELGRRILHHPHVNEQPFTRSLSGVQVPDGLDTVTVHAEDSVHGRGAGVRVRLPR